jgi:transcriptional regulator with XRE-family HTH domain
MNKRNLPDRYTDLRVEKGLSQTELAKAFDCNKQYISKVESGERSLSSKLLEKYADFFGVSTDYLLGRTDIKTTDTQLKDVCEYLKISEAAVNSVLDITEFDIPGNAEIFDYLISPAHRYSGDIRQLIANLKQLKAESAKLMNEQFDNGETFQSLELKINAISYNISLYASELIFEFDEKYKDPDKYDQLRAKYQKKRIAEMFDENIRKD